VKAWNFKAFEEDRYTSVVFMPMGNLHQHRLNAGGAESDVRRLSSRGVQVGLMVAFLR
jgi:hypothetical protein